MTDSTRGSLTSSSIAVPNDRRSTCTAPTTTTGPWQSRGKERGEEEEEEERREEEAGLTFAYSQSAKGAQPDEIEVPKCNK